MTANIYAHNADFEGMADYFKQVEKIGADAVLISDLGVFSVAKEAAPNLEIHVSTQANNTNYKSAQMWHQLGAKRIVVARELSLKRNQTNSSKYTTRYGNRSFCTRCYVYFFIREDVF